MIPTRFGRNSTVTDIRNYRAEVKTEERKVAAVMRKLALAKQIEEDLENTKYSEGSEGWFFLRGGTPARIDWDEKITYNPKKDNVKEFKYSTTLITRYEGDKVMWNELEFYQCAEEWQGREEIAITADQPWSV